MKVSRVPRPIVTPRGEGFVRQLRESFAAGDAVSVPINGETYAAARNRLCSTAYHVAKAVNASVRTQKSGDGLAVVIWLEPKADQPTGEQKEAKQ